MLRKGRHSSTAIYSMVQAYNFLASWQLFPEKCDFQFGLAPKSGNYKIESVKNGHHLLISINWVSVENEAFYSQYEITPDDEIRPFENQEIADSVQAIIINASTIRCVFFKEDKKILTVTHEILSNGYLRITHEGFNKESEAFTNIEIYHKQMSVLPYASSVGSVAIRPTKEGVIKHKALSAMEDQTICNSIKFVSKLNCLQNKHRKLESAKN